MNVKLTPEQTQQYLRYYFKGAFIPLYPIGYKILHVSIKGDNMIEVVLNKVHDLPVFILRNDPKPNYRSETANINNLKHKIMNNNEKENRLKQAISILKPISKHLNHPEGIIILASVNSDKGIFVTGGVLGCKHGIEAALIDSAREHPILAKAIRNVAKKLKAEKNLSMDKPRKPFYKR